MKRTSILTDGRDETNPNSSSTPLPLEKVRDKDFIHVLYVARLSISHMSRLSTFSQVSNVPANLDSGADVEGIGDQDGDGSSLDFGDSSDREEEWSASPPSSPLVALVSSEDSADETPASEASPLELVPETGSIDESVPKPATLTFTEPSQESNQEPHHGFSEARLFTSYERTVVVKKPCPN
jgi:hypothetical protein